MSRKGTWHIDVKRHFIRDVVLEKNIYIVFIGAENQHGAILIKRLNAKLLGNM